MGHLKPNRFRTLFGPGVMAVRQTLALKYKGWRMKVGSSHRPMGIDRCLAPGRPGRAEGIPHLYGYGVPDLHLDNPTSACAPVGICHSQFRRRRGSRPYNPGWVISVAKEWIASPLKCRELA